MYYYFAFLEDNKSYVFATTAKGLEHLDPSITKIEDLYVCDISEEHLADYLKLKKAVEALENGHLSVQVDSRT